VAKKVFLTPQTKHVQQEHGEGHAPIRQRATEDQVTDPPLKQIRWNQTFIDRGIAGQSYLAGHRPSFSQFGLGCLLFLLLPLAG
jgi:hypothetical protein